MKVVHVGQFHKAEDIRIFEKECCSLARAGYDVSFFTSDLAGDKIGTSVTQGVEVNIYPYWHKKQNGKGFIKLCQILYNTIRRPIALYFGIINKCPDIVHIHEARISYLVTALKKRNIKVIYDVHEDNAYQHFEVEVKKYGFFLAKIFAIWRQFNEHLACRNANLVIAATPHIKELVKPYSRKIVTIKNYAIINQSAAKTRKGEGKIACYVGGMAEYRKITTLVEISVELSGKLYLAGPIGQGYLNALKNNYVQAYNNKWFYKGVLNRQEVINLYAESTVGICVAKKTRNSYESLPIKIFEYMEAGLPVVVSDFPVWREIIDGAQCGFCVDEENPKEIVEKINYLFSHLEEAARMGANGRKAVLEKYNWGIEEKKLLHVYSEL